MIYLFKIQMYKFKSGPNSSERNNKLALFIFILSLIALLPFYNRGIIVHDEGYILYIADLMNRGKILYKDIFATYPPGIFLLLASIFKVFGTSIVSGRLIIVLTGAFINVLLYKLSSGLTNRKYALIPVILFIIWGIPQINIIWFSWFNLLFFLLEIHEATKKQPSFFHIGLYVGLSLLFKQTFGAVAAITAILAIIGLNSRRLTKLGITTIGLLVGLLPGIVYILFSGSASFAFNNIVTAALPFAKREYIFTPYPLIETGSIFSISFLAKKMLYWFPFGLLLSSVFIYRKKNKIYSFYLISVFLYFMAGIYPIADILHFNFVFPVAFPLSAAILFETNKKGKKILFAITFIFMLLIYILGIHKLYFRNYYAFEAPYLKQTENVIIRNDILLTDVKNGNFIKILVPQIRKITLQNDKIFVFPFAPLLYFASERDVSGKIVGTSKGILTLIDQKEIINSLENDKVKVVVLQIGVNDDKRSAQDLGYTKEKLLFDYLISNYKFYSQVEDMQIRVKEN